MCGVIGYWPKESHPEQTTAFRRLWVESNIRGLHAFGLYQVGFLTRTFDWEDVSAAFDPEEPAIAHARYSTSGDWHDLNNAQPIVTNHFALAMNGVISMGTKEEYEAEFGVQCVADNDAEVFLRRLEAGADPEQFLHSLSGSFAGVWLSDFNTQERRYMEEMKLNAGRNARRPLWKHEQYGAVWYASTRDIFLRAGFGDPTEVGVGVETVG